MAKVKSTMCVCVLLSVSDCLGSTGGRGCICKHVCYQAEGEEDKQQIEGAQWGCAQSAFDALSLAHSTEVTSPLELSTKPGVSEIS